VTFGKDNEQLVFEMFKNKFNKEVNIRHCGLFIDVEYGYLAASPDGKKFTH